MSYFKKTIQKVSGITVNEMEDRIAVEEPLQIFLRKKDKPFREAFPFAITMRTPGRDRDLVLGQLYTESLIKNKDEVLESNSRGPMGQIMDIVVSDMVNLKPFEKHRHVVQHSGCGVCGKTSLDFLEREGSFFHRNGLPKLKTRTIKYALTVLDSVQSTFHATGGVHAAALFDSEGKLVQLCEDVGRHNAMDKLVGWALDQSILPLKDYWLLLSGRTSFELVQKAHEAGISIIASIGAPSSLAVEMSEEHGITLIGFLKAHQMNVYNDQDRIEYVQDEMGS